MRTPAQATLLATPTVLAFFSGGFFTGPRLVAGVVVWLAAALLLVVREPRGFGARLPPRGPAAAVLAAMTLLAGWTAVSALWAPLGASASDAAERAVLYLGALAAAYLAFARRRETRWVEPALAAGALIVVGYGLAGRLLPDLVDQVRTVSSGGRLDQPLTYWNATGALAAIGLVLCASMAGDRARSAALRAAAAAGAAPLGLAVYLSFSRGALTALGVGVALLLALSPTWAQLRAGAIALEAGAICAAVASVLPAVEQAQGDDAASQGAVMLAVLVLVMAAAAAMQRWSARAEEAQATPTGPLPRRRSVVRGAAAAAAVLAIAPFVAAALDVAEERRDLPAFGATAERFGSTGSRRFDYWQAALRGFAEEPAAGHGAGSFAAVWLKERDIREKVLDAHSLELETAVELGVVGLALLLLVLGGVAVAARRAHAVDPALVAGPAAAAAVWAAHSAIDWDWELPAVTLVAALLAGALLAAADRAAQLSEQSALAR